MPSFSSLLLDADSFTPDFAYILEEWALYDPVVDWEKALNFLARAMFDTNPFDIYCPDCQSSSTYKRRFSAEDDQWLKEHYAGVNLYFVQRNVSTPELAKKLQNDRQLVYVLQFVCSRVENHRVSVVLRKIGSTGIEKIGQHPSLADLSHARLAQFRAVLHDDLLREIKKGLGLHAHGIGIGALIYLRRTIEFLVLEGERALGIAPSKTRFEDRILAVQGHVPQFLVDQRKMYGILSDGLHNQSEETCNMLFSPCLQGILIALEERAHKSNANKLREEAARSIDSVARLIDQSGSG